MTKPWKLKTNSSNILLVLIILLLIKAEWTSCESDESRLENRLEENSNGVDDVRIIEGNDEIARYLFKSSAQNNSLVLDNLMRCIESIRFVTCLKMLLLNRIDDAIEILESPALAKADLFFMNGLLAFKMKNDSDDGPAEGNENSEDVNLDREISQKVVKMFRNRCLQINLFSVYRIDISPVAGTKQDNFIRFGYKIYKEPEFKVEETGRSNLREGKKGGKRKKGGGMSMMMMIPQMLMLGFLPFTLASLKAMVMNAVMVNMMALNGAIFMTIRNLVFGPRKNSNVQYVNYGYSKGKPKQRKRPVLIIHSSAAFVKQPEFHSSNEHHGFEHAQSNHQLYENDFHKRRQDENQNAREKYVNRGYGDRRQTVERDRKKDNEFRNPNSNRPRTEGNRSKIILRKVVHRIL